MFLLVSASVVFVLMSVAVMLLKIRQRCYGDYFLHCISSAVYNRVT